MTQDQQQKFNLKQIDGRKNCNNFEVWNTAPNFDLDNRIYERVAHLSGPTYNVAPYAITENKFSVRNRLFVTNLPFDFTEEEFSEIFKPFGETKEAFFNKQKQFGFINFDFYSNAEKAKLNLCGKNIKGRTLIVRFANNNATIKISNLTPFVTNELLHAAFSIFGNIERCIIPVDTYGKSTGEGFIDYVSKSSAQLAIKYCTEKCFFLTSSLRPVIVEYVNHLDNVHGLPEKLIQKKSPEFKKDRSIGPRFAALNSVEHEYGTCWKMLHKMYEQKLTFLKHELQIEEEKLEAQMRFDKFDRETELLRKEIHYRELKHERQKRKWIEYEQFTSCNKNEEFQCSQENEFKRYKKDFQYKANKIRKEQEKSYKNVNRNNDDNKITVDEGDTLLFSKSSPTM